MLSSVRTATSVRLKNKARSTGSIAVLLRLPVDEFNAVEEAATHNGESVQQYIRDALGLRLYREKREVYREDQM
jgi:predicted DNA binding CopG/RHH family protein